MSFVCRLVLFAVALVCWSATASATDPERTLAQLHHAALRGDDGAPVGAGSMAQTEDGWLWVSTRTGLYRYDGFAFEKVSLLPPGSSGSESTGTIYAAPGGDLWVSRAYGGLARLRHDEVTLYGTADGLPDNVALNEFGSDGDGHLWASADTGLYRFDGTRWNKVSAAWGIQEAVDEFLEDARGNLWLSTKDTLYLLSKGATHFEDSGIPYPRSGHLINHPDGSVWLRTDKGIHPLPREWGKPFPHAPPRRANSTTTIFDRDGNLWSVACDVNLCRMPGKYVDATTTGDVEEPHMQKYSDALGMTSQATMNLMEDREGHMWVSTKSGLDVFRDSWLSRVRFPKLEVYFALVEDGAGRTWAGTASRTSYPDQFWQLTPDPVLLPGFEGAVTSAYRDTDGSVWLGGNGKLWHMRDGKPQPVPLPGDAAEQRTTVQAIARDGAGRLWISLRSRGVYMQAAEGWLPASTIAAFPSLAPSVIHGDPTGRAWFGYLDGTIAMLDGNALRRFGPADGLDVGPIASISTIGGRLVVGAEHGLSLFDAGRFRTLAAQPLDRFNSVTGIVQSKDGCVWAYGVAGLIRFSAEAWKEALDHPAVPVAIRLLGMDDGLPGPAQLVRPLPTVLATSDGRLWFAGSQGLAWLDPMREPPPPSPPPVAIRSVTSGSAAFKPGAVVDLRDNRNLHVAYTALAPGKSRGLTFRYRLEGVDATFQDAGGRREAMYTDLAPGRYMFVAEASYDGQRWSRSEPFTVTVAPRLFERKPFQILLALCIIVLAWLAHRWRVRLLTRRLRWRLNERHRERERIARELHDTLLQGVQGLILRFQAFADGLARDDRSRVALERTIDRAEALLVEGRDRVKGLRGHASEEGSLEQRIAALVEEMDRPVYLSVQSEHRRRDVDPVIVDELHSIVREAVVNASQHSHARSIRITVEYGRRSLSLCVRDDGEGFKTEAGKPRDDNHFGIMGMRERAARMGGKLDVVSTPQRGVVVKVKIPGRVAYTRKA
ncbi:sensor histidine kinase [Luteibacter sp.]|jgi:signal transduction histidine kinase/ligand-binding sensor domain-containing protein|uniref:sensor histidine kinase n=1 Tax=Luteibacter sp. TaxID=1886636 RepID=UPI002F3F4AB7